jgi:hypothetical protein
VLAASSTEAITLTNTASTLETSAVADLVANSVGCGLEGCFIGSVAVEVVNSDDDDDDDVPIIPVKDDDESNNNAGLLAGVVVAALAAIGIGMYGFYLKKKQSAASLGKEPLPENTFAELALLRKNLPGLATHTNGGEGRESQPIVLSSMPWNAPAQPGFLPQPEYLLSAPGFSAAPMQPGPIQMGPPIAHFPMDFSDIPGLGSMAPLAPPMFPMVGPMAGVPQVPVSGPPMNMGVPPGMSAPAMQPPFNFVPWAPPGEGVPPMTAGPMMGAGTAPPTMFPPPSLQPGVSVPPMFPNMGNMAPQPMFNPAPGTII